MKKKLRSQVLRRAGVIRLDADLQRRALADAPDHSQVQSDSIEFARLGGFWPEEWKRSKHSRAMINARLETAAKNPMFSTSFSGRTASFSRTAIEWKTVGKHKQPYRITLKVGELFAMAGIYAREPTEFDTAEKNPVNFAILAAKATKHSATFTTECLSSCRSAARRNGCRPLQPARTSSRPSAPILTGYPVTPK